jgi:hypothetical protein
MQNQNFLTENSFGFLFPEYTVEAQTNFKHNKELYNILQKLKKQNKNMSKSSYVLLDNNQVFLTIGGYQTDLKKSLTEYNSKDKNISQKDEEILKSLQKNVFSYVASEYINNYYKNNLGNAELLYKNWFVEYDKNSCQEIHTHGFTLLTMVYFVKVPKKLKMIGPHEEGCLVITDTKNTFQGTKSKYIKPEEGKIVAFPAYYPHYTLPIISDDTRAVIVEDIFAKRD